MSYFPCTRLLRLIVGWSAAALFVVGWPALEGPVLVALAGVVALAVTDGLRLAWEPRVRVGRVLPERAMVGRITEATLTVENPSARALILDLVDEPAADLAASEPTFREVHVPAGGRVTLSYPLQPTRRGDRPFGRIVVLEHGPLGLISRRSRVADRATLRVYPDASRFLDRTALEPKRVLATFGVRPVRPRGEGLEFNSLRDYVVGDDIRRIDWAATARRGRPVTRLYHHERNYTVFLAVDTSRLMGTRVGDRAKLDWAVDAALALAYVALAAGDRVGMLVFDADVGAHLAPRAHRRALGDFMELLRRVTARAVEADHQALVRALATRQTKRALVVVLTDFVDADPHFMVAPLVQLAHRHRVLLVALRDPILEGLRPEAVTTDEPPLAPYRRLVLDDVLADREIALARLQRSGLEVADLEPRAVTGRVLGRYLALREGGRL